MTGKIRRSLLLVVGCGLWAVTSAYGQMQVTVTGKVTYKSDGEIKPVEGAKIVLEPKNPGLKLETLSKTDGTFSLATDVIGLYSAAIVHPDFFEEKISKPLNLALGSASLEIELIPRATSSFSVEVLSDADDRFTVSYTEKAKTVSGDLADALPVTGAHKDIWNVIKIFPGVIAGPAGAATERNRSILFFNGDRIDQVNLTYKGLRIDDPISGDLGVVLGGVETVDMTYVSGRFSVDQGPGAGGTLAFEPRIDADILERRKRFKKSLTNFFPGVGTIKGITLDSWNPRTTFSGALRNNRIWFFNNTSVNYQKSLYLELPEGQDSVESWNLANIFGVQANLSPQSILNAGFLVNKFMAPRSGLAPFSPGETTQDLNAQRYFGYVNSETDIRGTLLRVGYGAYRAGARETPQGYGISQFFPDGRRGFAFQNIHRNGSRDELASSMALSAKQLPGTFGKRLGDHHMKFGLSISRVRFAQTADRTGYEHYRQSGTLAARVIFGASRAFRRSNLEQSFYAQNSWNISSALSLGMGLRWDRDGLLENSAVTPRFSTGFELPWLKQVTGQRTKFTAGLGWIPEKTNMRLLTQPDDQPSIFTAYATDGVTTLGDPSINVWRIPATRLKMPVSTNISFGLEQSLPGNLFAQFNVMRKRMHGGYAYVPRLGELSEVPSWAIIPERSSVVAYELQNSKRVQYESLEFALTKQLKEKYDWFGSFAFTPRARSNAALDMNADNPIQSDNPNGIMPGHIAKRLISWGKIEKRIPGLNIHLGEKNAFGYLLEWRDGLPYTIYDEDGRQAGEVNSWRLPRYFSLNLRWERRLSLRGKRLILRIGVDNLTNHDNPMDINRNLSSPNYRQLFGKQPRHVVLGIRSPRD